MLLSLYNWVIVFICYSTQSSWQHYREYQQRWHEWSSLDFHVAAVNSHVPFVPASFLNSEFDWILFQGYLGWRISFVAQFVHLSSRFDGPSAGLGPWLFPPLCLRTPSTTSFHSNDYNSSTPCAQTTWSYCIYLHSRRPSSLPSDSTHLLSPS